MKRFLEHKGLFFLFLNLMAFTGSSLIFVFQLLIGKVKELVFVPVAFNVPSLFIYLAIILLISLLEFVLLKRKKQLRKILHTAVFLRNHPLIEIIVEITESIFCCLLTFLLALPLGSEGPSVYLGFMVENFFTILLYKKRTSLENNRFGSMMGYALAFLNPLAGFFFFFEKKIRRGTTREMYGQIYLLVVSFLWLILWRYLYGIKDFYLYGLYNRGLHPFSSPSLYPLLFLIPLVTMGVSFLFKRFIISLSYFVKESEKSEVFFSIFMATVTVLALKFTGNYDLLGFSDEIFAGKGDLLLVPALFFFFVRFFWTVFSNDVYYLGGHVIPTLVVGGSVGMVLNAILTQHFALTDSDKSIILILCALSFFCSVTLNYFTTFALSFSFGPGYLLIPYLAIPIVLVYFVAKTFHRPSLPALQKRMKATTNKADRATIYAKTLSYKK